MHSKVVDNIFYCNLNMDMLKEVTIKIGLERINIQEGVIVKVLLDSGITELVMSLEFAKKQGFKLKIKRIYVRNINETFNK